MSMMTVTIMTRLFSLGVCMPAICISFLLDSCCVRSFRPVSLLFVYSFLDSRLYLLSLYVLNDSPFLNCFRMSRVGRLR
ncbi:hypothetical protein V8F06_008183 [Rhypophila decipiens]